MFFWDTVLCIVYSVLERIPGENEFQAR